MKFEGKSYHWLLAGSLVFAAIMIVVSTQRQLTAVEGTLLQILSLALGILWAEQQAARKGLPHGKSGLRRILSLYKSLARIRTYVQDAPNHYKIDEEGSQALYMLDNIIVEQLSTAEDAIEDWKDMLPKGDFEALLREETFKVSRIRSENGTD